MNWERGITRIYLVVWLVWAVTLTGAGILVNLKYGPPIRYETVRVPNTEHRYQAGDFYLKAVTEEEKASAPDSIPETREIPTGPARLHFEDLGFGQAMTTLAFAFVVPALLLMAFRWIVAGFRGRGTSEG